MFGIQGPECGEQRLFQGLTSSLNIRVCLVKRHGVKLVAAAYITVTSLCGFVFLLVILLGQYKRGAGGGGRGAGGGGQGVPVITLAHVGDVDILPH